MEYNCKVIEYEDSYHIQFYDKTLQREDNKENIMKEEIIEDKQYIQEELPIKERTKEEEYHCLKVSQNRSKNNLYRIARSNNWDLFITLTFDREKVDSSNYDEVVKKVKKFLNNLRSRGSPDLKYLLVPEFHKDGIHFHFHGLLANADSLILTDSGHTDYIGNKIYNIDNWHFGFTTATIVKDSARVSSYIGKYISKDMLNTLKNKHRYYASKNCNIQEENFYMMHFEDIMEQFADDIDYMKTVRVPISGQRIKYIEVKKRKNNNVERK